MSSFMPLVGAPAARQPLQPEKEESRGSRSSSPKKTVSPKPELQYLEQDGTERRACSEAGKASDPVKADSLESNLQVLRNSLHPMASDFLQAQEVVIRIAAQMLVDNWPAVSSPARPRPKLLEANQLLQRELQNQKEEASQLLEKEQLLLQELKDQQEQISQLLEEKQELQRQLGSQESLVSQLLEKSEQLQQELKEKENKVSYLLNENEWLRQEQIRRQRALGSQKVAKQALAPKAAGFAVQVWTTGQTGGCEKDFVDDVCKLLAGLGLSFQLEGYEANSEHFLLLFCPVVFRMGTDTVQALEALNDTRKALLVVLHHKQKDSSQDVVDTKRQVQHKALVKTVHACYSIQDGFYPCEMNKAAVASVAEAIKTLMKG